MKDATFGDNEFHIPILMPCDQRMYVVLDKRSIK